MLLADIVERNARYGGSRVAVDFAGAGGHRTWSQLRDRSARLANAVAERVEPGARVAILAENCAEYFECYYGAPDSGAALTLLNYRLHPAELVWIINDCRASMLMVQRKYAAVVLDQRYALPHLEHVVVFGDEPVTGAVSYEHLLADASTTRPRAAGAHDPAWVVYTSGTTGRPKGAVLSHRGLTTSVAQSAVHYPAGADARFLNAFPLCHVAGYMAIVNQLRGGMVLQQAGWDPERWLRTVQERGITSTGLAPSMLATVLEHPDIDRFDLRSLVGLGYGSAAMPLDVLRRAIDRVGPIVYTGYGMTELGGNVLALDRETHARAARGDEHLLASAGSPMCLADVEVVRADGTRCEVGEVGEITVRGEQLMLGYLDRPEATTETFRDGRLYTGDLARVDDEGFFYIVDRIKDMIVTGGENVYSVEVESALSGHPAVAETAVFGIPDDRWGEAVAAAVVLRAGHTATAEELTAFVRTRLAGYKRPRLIEFVAEIPKTATGKALKHQLRNRLRSP